MCVFKGKYQVTSRLTKFKYLMPTVEQETNTRRFLAGAISGLFHYQFHLLAVAYTS